MLEFRIDWEDSPKLRSRPLALTWARIEIVVEGRTVTRFWSEPTNAVRTGVYGSVFPLARWITRNWWNLLDEGLCGPDVLRGARKSTPHNRAWLARHNAALSREGMAYPDLSIYREDELVGLRWVPDPEGVTTPGRFIDKGAAHVDRAVAEAALGKVVDSVVERTAELDDEEVEELRSDWKVTQSSAGEERALSIRLAELGLDPYDADLDESLEELLSKQTLSEPLLRDLLSSSNPARLRRDLDTLRALLAKLPAADGATPTNEVPYDPLPYRAGYKRAHALRKRLDLDASGPVLDLDGIIHGALGAAVHTKWISAPGRPGVIAVVQRNGTGALAATERPPRPRRFLLARALHHLMYVAGGQTSRRLLTSGNDYQQAASRAFAAELLAPASALAARMHDGMEGELENHLADEFDVEPTVIVHQLVNHDFAR